MCKQCLLAGQATGGATLICCVTSSIEFGESRYCRRGPPVREGDWGVMSPVVVQLAAPGDVPLPHIPEAPVPVRVTAPPHHRTRAPRIVRGGPAASTTVLSSPESALPSHGRRLRLPRSACRARSGRPDPATWPVDAPRPPQLRRGASTGRSDPATIQMAGEPPSRRAAASSRSSLEMTDTSKRSSRATSLRAASRNAWRLIACSNRVLA